MTGQLAEIPSVIPRQTRCSDDSEERQWVERARHGDDAAYRWLLDRYRERAVRLAAHVLRRPDEAEDVAQEAFIRAFRSLSGFRGSGRFYTWLYHIVVRVCQDRMRLFRWRAEVALDSPEMESGASESDHLDTGVLVAALLDRLSPPIRAALVLREMEGLEYEEIAAVLRIPVGTVRSRLSTARFRFREMWLAAMEETNRV